jgi:hypothetical protein
MTELELCLQLLESDITAAQDALKRYRFSVPGGYKNAMLFMAIRWLRTAQNQLAVADIAARKLGLIADSYWCGVGHSKSRRRAASRK